MSFRYTHAFAATGLRKRADLGYRIAVDIDDRDDMKAMSQLQDRVPGPIFAPLIEMILSRFKRHLVELWSEADLLLIAKETDRLPDLKRKQILVPNVPQAVPKEDDIVPAGTTGLILLFVGSAGHRMNLEAIDWFLWNCWPNIVARKPDARVRIVGLGDWTAINNTHGKTKGVDIIGTVDDLSAEYAVSRLAICPVQVAAGSQIKVIEACGHARPVVATVLSATGFGEEILSEIASCRDATSFIEACIRFLDDPNLATKIGRRLRELQQKNLSRDSAMRQIARAINSLQP